MVMLYPKDYFLALQHHLPTHHLPTVTYRSILLVVLYIAYSCEIGSIGSAVALSGNSGGGM